MDRTFENRVGGKCTQYEHAGAQKEIDTTLNLPNMPSASVSILLLILPFVVLAACQADKKKETNPEQVKFSTSDASELFFRNVRQLYYDKTTMKDTQIEVYRIKGRDKTEDRPLLHLAIAINWRNDEAYILLEPNAYLQQSDTLKIMWQDSTGQQQGNYYFHAGTKEDQFRLAANIYHSIQQKHQLYLVEDGQKVRWLNDKLSREAFRKTVVDYFRLVDLL